LQQRGPGLDAACYNALLAHCRRCGFAGEAQRLAAEMAAHGIAPDAATAALLADVRGVSAPARVE
jgi:hypothetical protein